MSSQPGRRATQWRQLAARAGCGHSTFRRECQLKPSSPRSRRLTRYKLCWGISWCRVQELCESRGVRPELPVLLSLTVSVDVKQHWTMLRHWSQFVPNMSARHPRTLSSTSSSLFPGALLAGRHWPTGRAAFPCVSRTELLHLAQRTQVKKGGRSTGSRCCRGCYCSIVRLDGSWLRYSGQWLNRHSVLALTDSVRQSETERGRGGGGAHIRQNQHTRELIIARKTSYKYNNKDLNCLR